MNVGFDSNFTVLGSLYVGKGSEESYFFIALVHTDL